ncbi:hypothetical protein WA026_013112 [Henosepilachna vigintioctopunctata]|uniref:Protein rolling stone n=1 Tax=Henosepilachna vigintioctopunctata TaxID=420089 RepID=A0AAW1UI76_9CUCU
MVWNEQFQKKKFKFVYDRPEQIVLCRWQTDTRTTTAYLLYRMAFLTFFLGTLYFGGRKALIPCSAFKKINKGAVWAYYTTWSEMFCTLAAVSACIITVNQYIRDEDYEEDSEMNVYECRTWFRVHMVLYTLALDSSISLIVGYFGFVYFNEKKIYLGISFVVHLWNGVVMLLDFALSSMPTHLFHFYAGVCLAFIYGFCSWLYYMLGGENVHGGEYLYKLLNWKEDPWVAVLFVFASSVLLVVVRLLVFTLSVIRDTIFYKYYYVESDADPKIIF